MESVTLPCHIVGMTKHPKRPRDANQLAKEVIDLATMDEQEKAVLIKKVKQSERKGKVQNQTPGKRGSLSKSD